MSSGMAQAMIETTSALLRQGRTLDHLSRLLTVAALVMLIGARGLGVASPALGGALGGGALATGGYPAVGAVTLVMLLVSALIAWWSHAGAAPTTPTTPSATP